MPVQFRAHLRDQGLAKNTIDTYDRYIDRIPSHVLADVEALAAFASEDLRDTPEGTFLPHHAALTRWMHFRHGIEPDAARQRLPGMEISRRGRTRESLSEEQLDLYLSAVRRVPSAPMRTVLLLLPLTGGRISEMCTRRVGDYCIHQGRWVLYVPAAQSKSGHVRILPLIARARATLDDYVASQHPEREPEAWLFPGVRAHLTAGAVQKACRGLRNQYPQLGSLTPHVLRHTFGTRAVQQGVNLRLLQEAMGHRSVQTTEQYTHPTTRDVADALEVL